MLHSDWPPEWESALQRKAENGARHGMCRICSTMHQMVQQLERVPFSPHGILCLRLSKLFLRAGCQKPRLPVHKAVLDPFHQTGLKAITTPHLAKINESDHARQRTRSTPC